MAPGRYPKCPRAREFLGIQRQVYRLPESPLENSRDTLIIIYDSRVYLLLKPEISILWKDTRGSPYKLVQGEKTYITFLLLLLLYFYFLPLSKPTSVLQKFFERFFYLSVSSIFSFSSYLWAFTYFKKCYYQINGTMEERKKIRPYARTSILKLKFLLTSCLQVLIF